MLFDGSPARRAHSSKPTAAGLLLWIHAGTDRRTDRQTERRTDGRTPYCYTDPARHTMQAVPVTRRYGGAENESTRKRKYGKSKYESAGMENTSTENASTMQTFSQIKKVWYVTS